MSEAATALKDLQATIQATVPARRVNEAGTVVSVDRDANQFARAATVRLSDGQTDVVVPLYGPNPRTGQGVVLSRAVGRPVGAEWQFVGVAAGNVPLADMDADIAIPSPAWQGTALTSTALPATAGGQLAQVIVHLVETPQKYGPRATEIQWRIPGDTIWASVSIEDQANTDATLDIVLPASFGLGVAVDVRARTHTLGTAYSIWSDVRTIVTSGDTTTPSAPGAFTVDLTLNLTAKVNLPPPSQPLVFDHWDISVAGTSAGGAGTFALLPQTYTTRTQQFLWTAPQPGTVYIRIREVTKSGVAGPWNPSAAWAGPYAIIQNDTIVDVTPPPAPTVQSVVAAAGFDANGNVNVTLTITLVAYTPPGDFAYFSYRLHNGTNYEGERPSPNSVIQVDHARQGVTYQVAARAFDTSGNSSAYSANVAVVTPTLAQPPSPGAAPAVTPAYRAAIISFAQTASTPSTGQIIGYQLQRSPNTADPNAWFLAATIPAFPDGQNVRWIDSGPLADGNRLGAGIAYGWRYRPVNSLGVASAAWSPFTVATTLKVDGGDLVAGSVTANTLEATLTISAGKKISVGAGGTIESGNAGVKITDQGMDVVGQVVRFIRSGVGNIGSLYASFAGSDGVTFRIEGGRLHGEDILDPQSQWRIDPDVGLTGGTVDGIAQPEYQYGRYMKHLYGPFGGGLTAVGRQIMLPHYAFFNLSSAGGVVNSWSPKNTSIYVVNGPVIAFYIRGFVNIANGQFCYIYQPDWGIESGIAASPTAGNTVLIPLQWVGTGGNGTGQTVSIYGTAAFTVGLTCLGVSV